MIKVKGIGTKREKARLFWTLNKEDITTTVQLMGVFMLGVVVMFVYMVVFPD